jgi:5-methylcytosine-specific restriction endonuclease McrA
MRAQNRENYLANREERIAKQKALYRSNPQPIIDRATKWNKDHPERHNEHTAKWSKLNPANGRESCKRHREAHPEYHKARLKKWAKNNPLKIRLKSHNRRVATSDPTQTTDAFIRALYLYQGSRCAGCFKDLNGKFHVDHMIPISSGGGHIDENIQILCPNCNRSKHKMGIEAWATRVLLSLCTHKRKH